MTTMNIETTAARINEKFAAAETKMNELITVAKNASTVEESIAAAKAIVVFENSEYAYALYLTKTTDIAEMLAVFVD